MGDSPEVIPLYPPRGRADEEESNWRRVFQWIADHPSVQWRDNPKARALVAAAEAFMAPAPRARQRHAPRRRRHLTLESSK